MVRVWSALCCGAQSQSQGESRALYTTRPPHHRPTTREDCPPHPPSLTWCLFAGGSQGDRNGSRGLGVVVATRPSLSEKEGGRWNQQLHSDRFQWRRCLDSWFVGMSVFFQKIWRHRSWRARVSIHSWFGMLLIAGFQEARNGGSISASRLLSTTKMSRPRCAQPQMGGWMLLLGGVSSRTPQNRRPDEAAQSTNTPNHPATHTPAIWHQNAPPTLPPPPSKKCSPMMHPCAPAEDTIILRMRRADPPRPVAP